MSKNITLRKAIVGDCADLAILDNIASHGLSHWFWQGAVNRGKADDAFAWGRQRMMDTAASHGYSNAVVAVTDGVVAGVAVGYLMDANDVLPEKAFDPVIAPVFELFAQCDGEWLLDNLAVYSMFRKQGIGGRLLDDCFSRARKSGATTLSLVAEDGNETAISLYLSRGFKVRDKREYVPFKKGIETKNWLLLSAPVN